jgi:hypothetical protein
MRRNTIVTMVSIIYLALGCKTTATSDSELQNAQPPAQQPVSIDPDAPRHVQSLPGMYIGTGPDCSLEITLVDADKNLLFVIKSDGKIKEKKYSKERVESSYRQFKNTHDKTYNRNISIVDDNNPILGNGSSERLGLEFASAPDADVSTLIGGSWYKSISNGQFVSPTVDSLDCWRLTKQ